MRVVCDSLLVTRDSFAKSKLQIATDSGSIFQFTDGFKKLKQEIGKGIGKIRARSCEQATPSTRVTFWFNITEEFRKQQPTPSLGFASFENERKTLLQEAAACHRDREQERQGGKRA